MGIWSIFRRQRSVYASLKRAMCGKGSLRPSLILVVHAIRTHVENPATRWKVLQSACEAFDNKDAITVARKAVLSGIPGCEASTFDIAEDGWVCYLACELDVDPSRVVCVEVLSPYSLDDCGQLLEVTIVQGMHRLPRINGREWVIDVDTISLVDHT